MPRPGQMTETCVVVAWRKREGDPVHKGDVLFEIETDKAVMDVEAFDEGTLLRRCVEEGQEVPVNAVCAYIGQPGEAIPDTLAPGSAPVAPGAASPSSARPAGVPSPGAVGAAPPPPAGRPRISPRAARLAAEAGIDVRTLTGTGPEGRITEADVRAAIRAPAAGPAAGAAMPTAPAVPGEEPPEPLSAARRTIAARLTQSWSGTPHFTVTVAVDVSALGELRRGLKAAGSRLTLTDFVVAATARALVEFPDVNARTDGRLRWRHSGVHVGLAVAAPAGLVVPVIHEADRKTVHEIHARSADLIAAAREGRLTLQDLTGGTFTVSNLGMFEVDAFSAIINPGQAAILAVASVVDTPVVRAGGLAVRPVMRLTLSADHRLVDGEMGARFINTVRQRLEDGVAWRNEVAHLG